MFQYDVLTDPLSFLALVQLVWHQKGVLSLYKLLLQHPVKLVSLVSF